MDKDIERRFLSIGQRVCFLESAQEMLQENGVVYQDLHGVIIKNGDIVKVNPVDDDCYNLVIEYNGCLVLATELRSTFKTTTNSRLRDMVHGTDNPVEIVGNLWHDNLSIKKVD